MKLHIGKNSAGHDFTLPVDAATQTFAFIARKGAGKTYAAGKLVEELIRAEVQCVILDTVGNWYGLRLAAEGSGKPGLDVPVLGGLRGDIPITAEGGALVADIIADSGRSLIIDISQFSKSDRKRFATALGEKLWARKKAEPEPTPLHLVLEECQLIVPQFVGRDDARMVGVYEEIIRLGRNYGIGCSMITQRPQSVNKEVLTQTECLVVLQVNGVPERKALKEWIVQQGMDVHLVDALPSLPIGTAFIWSPQWLNILEKVVIGKKWTLDASSTPKVGEKKVRRELKPLDLADLREKMAATIERAKAEDPKALMARIRQLEQELKKKPAAEPVMDAGVISQAIERAVAKALTAQEAEWQKAIATFKRLYDAAAKRVAEAHQFWQDTLPKIDAAFVAIPEAAHPGPVNACKSAQNITEIITRPHSKHAMAVLAPVRHVAVASSIETDLDGPSLKILGALTWWRAIDVNEPTLAQLAAVAGYTPTGGSFGTYLSRLSTQGLIERGGGRVSILYAGLEVSPSRDVQPTLAELHDMIRGILDGPGTKIINTVIARGGAAVSAAQIAEETGYEPTGGSFGTYLSRLSSLGLIHRARGMVEPTEVLFPPGLH